jgi:hypothetical protein
MSKPNKVNKSNYDQAGRLTPDELAREHKKQMGVASHAKDKERASAKAPQPHAARDDTRPRNESEE